MGGLIGAIVLLRINFPYELVTVEVPSAPSPLIWLIIGGKLGDSQ
jgi:hypothetical protein